MLYIIFGPLLTPRNMLAGLFAFLSLSFFAHSRAQSPAAPSPDRLQAPVEMAALGSANPESVRASVLVGGEEYAISILEGSTVYDAMEMLRRDGKISFQAKSYPSLGYLIEEIAGKKSKNGYYWTFFVNGAYSDRGASATKIRDGDRIEWRYQKGI